MSFDLLFLICFYSNYSSVLFLYIIYPPLLYKIYQVILSSTRFKVSGMLVLLITLNLSNCLQCDLSLLWIRLVQWCCYLYPSQPPCLDRDDRSNGHIHSFFHRTSDCPDIKNSPKSEILSLKKVNSIFTCEFKILLYGIRCDLCSFKKKITLRQHIDEIERKETNPSLLTS